MKKAAKTIEKESLILRPIRISDYRNAYKNYLTDEKTTKFMDWDVYKNKLQSLAWCFRSRKNPFHWAIALKENNQIIGAIASMEQSGILAEGDTPDKTVYDIGYCVGSKWWGRGIMPEAAKAVVDYLLSEVNIDIITAMHDINNPNSGKVMRKIGMEYIQNVFRPHYKDEKKLVEHSLYQISKK